MAREHRWTFFRAGGFDQVKLQSSADLMALDKLDQKLWVALACPTTGLDLDTKTLALVDTDNDGRVRAGELIAASKFATSRLKNPDDVFKGEEQLPLAAIDDATPEGKALLASARQILTNIGKPDATSIGVDDVADPARIFADSAFNGDGVITELSVDDEPSRALLREIMAAIGSVPDRSGKPGVNGEQLEAFFADLALYDAWLSKAEADAPAILPLGLERTQRAFDAITALEAKMEDYFARCRLSAFDARALRSLNRAEEDYLAIAAQDLTVTAAEIAAFPLAEIGPDRPLPLSGPVNPAHASALTALTRDAITTLLGPRATLTYADWQILRARIAPHQAWFAEKPAQRVDSLGPTRVREILRSGQRQTLTAALERDRALEAEAANVGEVERLVRYHRDLARLCKNFVSFEDFYDDDGQAAIFQAGTLYLDQRACELTLRVQDPAKHATMAGLAGAYLAYLDCTRKDSPEKVQIVAAFTAGDRDNLMVGRNGVFYDRQGRDWDATITKIVDNPISLREAFWAPYKKFVRMIEEQVAKRAAAGDANATSTLQSAAASTAQVGSVKPPETKKVDIGTVAALGVAVGAIGTFVTALIGYATGLFRLGLLATAAAFIGVILVISLPSVILAYIKLRKRNLGPILDANGWAVNAKARINVPFGATLSSVARLPPGSRRTHRDRYADRGFPWKTVIILLLLAYGGYRWWKGDLDRFLPGSVRAGQLFGRGP